MKIFLLPGRRACRVIPFLHPSPDETPNFAYEYDSRGNIAQETYSGKVTTYTYDALGQRIRVNDPNDLRRARVVPRG